MTVYRYISCMDINQLLTNKNMSKYRLSKLTSIPYSTLNDIVSKKTDIMNCSVSTVYKIAQALDVSIEILINTNSNSINLSIQPDFEAFRSNVKQAINDNNPYNFIKYVHKENSIRKLYDEDFYSEAFYLLATIDYLSRIYNIPIFTEFNDLRKYKLQDRLYPASVINMANVNRESNILEQSFKNSILEFKRFNIIENEIDIEKHKL